MGAVPRSLRRLSVPAAVTGEGGAVPRPSGHAGDGGLLASGALVFLAAAAATVHWCGPMAAGMPMPGGWTLSMTWMPMRGQGRAVAWAAFVALWTVMMAAMMLPALLPLLVRDRRALAAGAAAASARPGGGAGQALGAALEAAGYFTVWAAVGAALYPLGLGLASAALHSPAVARAAPALGALALLAAGALQLTRWKARQLACFRPESACALTPGQGAGGARAGRGARPERAERARPARPVRPVRPLRAAWRGGLRLGAHCVFCCAGLMAVLLVLGAMDLRATAGVAAALTAERLLPRPALVARSTGIAILALGALLLLRALGGA